MADITITLTQTHANMLRRVLRDAGTAPIAIRYYADGVVKNVVEQLEKALPPHNDRELMG